MNNDQKTKEAEIPTPEVIRIIIPECCREGWDTCEHVARKPKRMTNNVGL